jgi:hypothetical protein
MAFAFRRPPQNRRARRSEVFAFVLLIGSRHNPTRRDNIASVSVALFADT